VDQGIGRALWFIHGGCAPDVASAVARFADRRQPDLWSGVGLAATFAGGSDTAALATLRDAAKQHQPELALGAVFAATARSYSGFVPDHTHAAITALGGLSLEAAVELGVGTAVDANATGPVPPYELWRHRIREHFAAQAERLTG
jgi:hypothetical protein